MGRKRTFGQDVLRAFTICFLAMLGFAVGAGLFLGWLIWG